MSAVEGRVNEFSENFERVGLRMNQAKVIVISINVNQFLPARLNLRQSFSYELNGV